MDFNVSNYFRTQLKEQLHALTYLMEALDFILKEGGGYSHDNHLQYFPALDVSTQDYYYSRFNQFGIALTVEHFAGKRCGTVV